MKQTLEQSVVFDEDDVAEWCEAANDDNPLHLDEDTAADGVFGERVVPGMMVLDRVSGMLTSMGEDDEEVILASIVAARFRDPILFDEQIDIRATVTEKEKNKVSVQIEVRAPERESLTVTAVIMVVVK